jgi:outer membrane protein OmpA-like peptidoglycan-associated protein
MKPSPFFCRALLIVCLFPPVDLLATHSLSTSTDSLPCYVVIGAFSKHRNAVRFTAQASKNLQLKASFELNPARNLYYVYSLVTNDRSQAIAEVNRLRSETELQDAWVYSGSLGKAMIGQVSKDVNPVTTQVIENVMIQDSEAAEDAQVTLLKDEPQPIREEVTEPVAVPEVRDKTPPVTEEEANAPGKPFIFKLTRMVDKKVISTGEIEVVDTDKAKLIKKVDANVPVKIIDVKNKSGKVTVVAQATGYRKVQREINYNATPADSAISMDEVGRTVVPFEMVRLKKGDFAILYNVFYFRDAAIIRPESRYEVDALVDMMRENPNCVIRLHGHTNGNHAGKIIYWDETSSDMFSLDGSRVGYGSAKELSGARAAAIQAYLISQGIDASRCSVVAWGGKKAIHDKLSARAQENIRVEIEIVKDN